MSFRVPPQAGFRVRRGEEAPKGLGQGTVGGGELVHRAASGVAPQGVAEGPSPAGFRGRAKRKPSASPRLCLSALKNHRGMAGPRGGQGFEQRGKRDANR